MGHAKPSITLDIYGAPHGKRPNGSGAPDGKMVIPVEWHINGTRNALGIRPLQRNSYIWRQMN